MNNIRLFGQDFTPERIRQAVMILFVALFAYNVYNTTWPSIEAFLTKRGEIEQQDQKIQAASSQVYTRDQIEARLRDARASLSSIQNRFPLRNQILSILLVDLSQIFKDSGTYLANFEPLGFKPLEQGALKNLGRMQIKIAARGDYPSIITLFDKLSKYDRVLRIEQPSIVPKGGGAAAAAAQGEGGVAAQPASVDPGSAFNRTLDVSFTLTTYALNR